MSELNKLLSEHVGVAFARQLAFADLIGERGWGVKISDGEVTFGNDMKFPIQLLGTEATGNQTWLWAWANTQSGLPESLLVAANRLKGLGSELNIPELTTPTFPLSLAHGHLIASIASGVDGTSAYYRGPYEGGALFFLVSNLPPEIFAPSDLARILTLIPQVISEFDVQHRPMVTALLTSQGFTLASTDSELTATRGTETITLGFDQLGRISKIGGQIPSNSNRQARKSRNKPWWKFW